MRRRRSERLLGHASSEMWCEDSHTIPCCIVLLGIGLYLYNLSVTMQLSRATPATASRLPSLVRPATASRACVVRAVHQEAESSNKLGSLAMAGLVAAALLGSAIVPEEAQAGRSGGRAGGGGGFSSRRAAAPSRAAP